MATKTDDDPRRFLHPDTIARISRLDLRARQVVEGFISGMHRSPFFGHSVEFVQHREYTRGDDIRHLDWKVWSKTDKYYVKQFEEETNLRCTLVVDVSNSMRYGRGPLNKYEYGCTVAACLGYLLLRRHDVLVFHLLDQDEMTFPFAGTTRFEGMEEVIHLLCDPRALRDGYLEALEEYLVEVRRGCSKQGIDYMLVHTGQHLDAV